MDTSLVLKATPEQAAELEKFCYVASDGNKYGLKFIEDADGNLICGSRIVENKAYIPIRAELEKLDRIPYNRKIIE